MYSALSGPTDWILRYYTALYKNYTALYKNYLYLYVYRSSGGLCRRLFCKFPITFTGSVSTQQAAVRIETHGGGAIMSICQS